MKASVLGNLRVVVDGYCCFWVRKALISVSWWKSFRPSFPCLMFSFVLHLLPLFSSFSSVHFIHIGTISISTSKPHIYRYISSKPTHTDIHLVRIEESEVASQNHLVHAISSTIPFFQPTVSTMPRPFSQINLIGKRPRSVKAEQKRKPWYHRLCCRLLRLSDPSSGHYENEIKDVSGSESASSPALSEERTELDELAVLLERTLERNEQLSQQEAVEMHLPSQPRPTETSRPGRLGSHSRRSFVVITPPAPMHSVNEEFDKELAALAQLRWDCLVFLCSIHGKEKERDGYVSVPISWVRQQPTRGKRLVIGTRYPQVEIESLDPSDQNIHYENALSRAASLDEVRSHYETHLCRLEHMREGIAIREKASRGMRRLASRRYDAWCKLHRKEPKQTMMIRDKAEVASLAARRTFEVRLKDWVAEGGIMRLLLRCEEILEKANHFFVPVVWMRKRRSRWADARRGWTGLAVDEMDERTAEAATL